MKKLIFSLLSIFLALNYSFAQANLLNAKKPSDIASATMSSDKGSIDRTSRLVKTDAERLVVT